VVTTYPDGQQKAIFNTTAPALVESEMYALIEWTNNQWQKKTIHPIIVLAVFVYEFLSIHPFQDGNGRLSRLLTTLFLLQQGYEFIQYISFENHIEKNKKAYYEALMTAQRKRITNDDILDKWLIFFLESIKELTVKLDVKYNLFKQKGGYMNNRQKQIRDYITENQPIKVGGLSEKFPEISLATLKKDLQYLRDEQVLVMVGKGKGSVYVIKNHL
jgi:Fic family protein